MTQIFLSYSRKDLDFVEQLASDLKESGLDVWYDLSGLDGGSRWRNSIEKAIRESQYVVIVLSPDSVSSEWVEREYLFASNLGRKIVPVLLRPCELPLYYLNIHYIDFQDGKYKQNYPLLLRVLNGEQAQQGELVTPSQVQKKKNEKSAFKIKPFPVISLGLIIAAIFGASYIFNKQEPTPTMALTSIVDTPTYVLPTETSPPTKVVTPTIIPLQTDITDDKGVEMVFVPEGSFLMGNKKGDDRDEQDEHTVTLSAYYIDKYEVTNKLYKTCENEGGCDKHGNPYDPADPGNYYINSIYDEYPVIFVDWEMANKFCDWRDARLPTEAEWEKAAKGDTNYSYPWGNTIDCDHANYFKAGKACTVLYPAKVGSAELGTSPYGAYDMAGNVWEWTADWYDPYYYQTSVEVDPPGPKVAGLGGREKVIRGGSWLTPNDGLRPSNRFYFGDFGKSNTIGFRCARSLDQ